MSVVVVDPIQCSIVKVMKRTIKNGRSPQLTISRINVKATRAIAKTIISAIKEKPNRDRVPYKK